MALEMPLRKRNLDQKSISFMGPSIWNKSRNDLKILNTVTLFTHNHKKVTLHKNFPNKEFFLSLFSRIWTEYRDLWSRVKAE